MRQRAATLAVLVLLPLAGCASGTADPVVPPAPAAASAPAPSARATASTAPRPAVPTTRATLRPVTREPQPRRLRIGALDLDLPVVPVGVDRDGLMELPETVRQVGWYRFGPPPGADAGTAVLAGHVDTLRDGLGPFARLRELDEGDELVVEVGGTARRYVVRSVARVAKSEVPLDRVFRRDGAPTLALITCGGSFSRRDGYADNLIVTAIPR